MADIHNQRVLALSVVSAVVSAGTKSGSVIGGNAVGVAMAANWQRR